MRARGLLLRQLGIILGCLQQPVVGRVGRVVREHVEDEALLDGLPHAVDVERLGLAARARAAEQLQRLALGRGGEGEEAQVRLPPARLHDLVEPVFPVGLVFLAVSCAAAPRIAFSSRAVSPVWLECASSTMTAYRRAAMAASHSFACCRFSGARLVLALGAGRVEQSAQHERKLLQRRDHDLACRRSAPPRAACESWSIAFTTPCACSIW